MTYISHESISPNTDDNTTAVIMYLAMSINHLPNSFLIAKEVELCKVKDY